MYRCWQYPWMIAALGLAVGSAVMWFMTFPPASALASASLASPSEPNAALIDIYLTHIRTGVSAYGTQRFDAATQAFEAAAALQPSEPLAYRYLAELHWRAEKLE